MTYSNQLFMTPPKAEDDFPALTLLSQVKPAEKNSSTFAFYGNDGYFSKVISPRVITPLLFDYISMRGWAEAGERRKSGRGLWKLPGCLGSWWGGGVVG